MALDKYCFVLALIMIRVSSFLGNLHTVTSFRRPASVDVVKRLSSTSATHSDNAKKRDISPLLAMELPNNDSSELLLKTRHTSAHILAMAVQKTYPDVKVTIGPWIESG